MANRNPRTISPTKSNRMNELFKLIESGNNEELQHEANMFKLRNSFARDVRVNVISSKPRRQKYSVDTSHTDRNAQLSNSVHPDNVNNDSKNLIKGSLTNLFDSETQFGKSYGDFWDRGPYGR